jgi:hypothetical protein
MLRLIKSLILIAALTLAPASAALADADQPAAEGGIASSAWTDGALPASDPQALPKPSAWINRPPDLDFLMRDLSPLQAPAPAAPVNHFRVSSRLYELAPEQGLNPRDMSSATMAPELQARSVKAELETSRLFIDQRLTLSGGLTWDRTIYDPYWSSDEDKPEAAVATMTYGLGAEFTINDEWSAAAALIKRESSATQNRPARRPAFTGYGRLQPSDLMLSQFGLQLLKPDWGLRARFTAYYGQIGQAVPEGDPSAGMADLRGLELNLQKRLLDGRLSLEVAAMLNYLAARNSLALSGLDGENLSAYLGLTFADPALLNASVLLRYAGDGNYVDSYLLSAVGASSLLDARIWRDFALSPALTLSTQLYGSSLIEAYYRNLLEPRPPLSTYMEGRLTMSYSF